MVHDGKCEAEDMWPAVWILPQRSSGGKEEVSPTRHATERRGLAAYRYDHAELQTTCICGAC